MNPDTTVYIPAPLSEKPKKSHMRYCVIGKDSEGRELSGNSYYERDRGFMKDLRKGFPEPIRPEFTHWLKPVKLSEIATSQPVSEWQLCPKCKGDVCWQDTIVDGQNISITACTMCKGEGKILPPSQPAKTNEDILVKALEQIEQMSDPGSYEKAIVDMKQLAGEALSSYRTSVNK